MGMNMFDLTGKVALITGGSYGIGYAIASGLSAAGATITFNDINQDLVDKGIEAYKAALEQNGKTFEIYVYEGVNHAFNNDTSAARYDKAAADLAWKRTVDFFRTHLS